MTATAELLATEAAPRWRRMLGPVATTTSLAAATLALAVRDPHVQGSWGQCPSLQLFGVYCPGCGGLRAVNDLTHLQVGQALSSNLFFVLSLPLVVFLLGRYAWRKWHGHPQTGTWLSSPVMLVVGGVALTVFTVLRNFPAGSWLAP